MVYMLNKKRKKYQVFTPKKVVKLMLDSIGYNGPSIIHKTIVDISCGDGAFLCEALERYIDACKSICLPSNEIVALATKHIFGFEIDKDFFDQCVFRMKKIIHDTLNYSSDICFSGLIMRDGLTYEEERFDFVVGNPPYLSYKEMDVEQRKCLSATFACCKSGKFDYSYAFIEKSINLLKDNGLACIISPINMYQIKSGCLIRNCVKNKIFRIIDVTEENIFPGVLTNPVISFFCLKGNDGFIEYIKGKSSTSINTESFLNNGIFRSIDKSKPNRFGDFFSVHNGVATLYNKAFIVQKNSKIEKGILKKACSPKEFRYKTNNQIIFPYRCQNGRIERLEEQEFKSIYPKAYAHLLGFKQELLKRDTEKTTKWFEYGRTQALKSVCSPKVLIPAIFSENIKPVILDDMCVVYAGFYVLSKDPANHPLSEAVSILSNPELFSYIQRIGVKMNGKTYRYSAKDLEEFRY